MTCPENFSFSLINNTNYRNCYEACVGEIVNGECISVLPLVPVAEDEPIVVEVPPADIVLWLIWIIWKEIMK